MPWEVVEPLSYAQICGHQASPRQWLVRERADLKREATEWRGVEGKNYRNGKRLPDDEIDVNGWPKVADCLIVLSRQYHGRHMVRFRGKANVEAGEFYNSGSPVTWYTTPDGSGETYTQKTSKGKFGKAMLPKGVGIRREREHDDRLVRPGRQCQRAGPVLQRRRPRRRHAPA